MSTTPVDREHTEQAEPRHHRLHLPRRRTGRRERDPWFDNAKMLLVTLVVVGHSWTLVPGITLLYDWMYLWHMPAFLMVTGYLSRRFTWSRRNLRRLLTTVVLPYLLFEGLFALFRVHVGGEELDNLWLEPHWPLWFLAVLAFWRLATPVLKRVPHPFLFSLAVSLLGGLVTLPYLDGNRALGFLPYFVAGLVISDEVFARLRDGSLRRVALAVLALGVPVAVWVRYGLLPDGSEWLYFRNSYGDLDYDPLLGMAVRAAVLTAGFAMAAAALTWVPRSHGWFSRLGAGSLVVYLFHGFFVKAADYAGVPDWADRHAVLSVLVVTAAAVAVSLLLSWRPVRKPLEKVITPVP